MASPDVTLWASVGRLCHAKQARPNDGIVSLDMAQFYAAAHWRMLNTAAPH